MSEPEVDLSEPFNFSDPIIMECTDLIGLTTSDAIALGRHLIAAGEAAKKAGNK